MFTNATKIKEYAKEHDLKLYEICVMAGISNSNFYATYMHSTDENKLNKIINAVEEYLKNNNK